MVSQLFRWCWLAWSVKWTVLFEVSVYNGFSNCMLWHIYYGKCNVTFGLLSNIDCKSIWYKLFICIEEEMNFSIMLSVTAHWYLSYLKLLTRFSQCINVLARSCFSLISNNANSILGNNNAYFRDRFSTNNNQCSLNYIIKKIKLVMMNNWLLIIVGHYFW